MNAFAEGIITIALAVIGLAIISVLVSKNAQTSNVIQSWWSGINNGIATAQSPVTGSQVSPNLAYPGGGFGS